jgi:hypothetical protein
MSDAARNGLTWLPTGAHGDRNLRAGANKPGLLTLTIKDKSALYLAYMPFFTNGM